MKDKNFKLTPLEFIEGIGTDLKLSIDDLIHEIKTLKKDMAKIKTKIKSKKSNT
jgi:hypothetical protein